MATIDQEGLEGVNKIKDALNHLHSKLDNLDVYDNKKKKINISNSVNEEYSFIFKILGQMEDEWNHNINRVYTVPDELTINGKRYTS